jgi:hypothetical protein
MPVSKKYEPLHSANKNKSLEIDALHELLLAFRKHGLDIPFERLGPILEEHQLLMEHRSIVNELAHQDGPSHIKTTISRQKNHEHERQS